MAKVQLCNITVMDNPSPFSNPFQFEITFECIEELKEDLEWKMIYVGSAESEEYDQVLDSVYVGPIPEGKHMFVFQADPPNVDRIPENDAIGVTVVLLTCSYRSQEFIRVGYFINNEYTDQELRENPPSPPQFEKVIRNILASEPRVTRFKINWEEPTNNSAQENSGPSSSTTTANGTVANGNAEGGPSTSTAGGGGGPQLPHTTSPINQGSGAAHAQSSSSMEVPSFNDNSNSWATMECS